MVAGASGLIGSFLLKKLIDDGLYQEILVLTRRPLQKSHPKIREIIINFDQLGEALQDVPAADVFCCLGTTMKKAGSKEAFRKADYEYPVTLAKTMRSNGSVRFLLVTALGANSRSIIFYNRVKGEVEESIRNLGYSSLYIFRPSLLLGERNESRKGEDIAKKTYRYLDRIFIGPFKKYKAVHGAEVAEAMITKAKEGEKGIHVIESDKIRAS